MTYKPQLCFPTEQGAPLPTGSGWVMEQKFDGWRFLFERTDDGIKAYGGRNGRDHTGQAPDVEEWLMACLPPGTTVDGELVPLNKDDAVSTILSQAGTGRLAYVAFDVLEVGHVPALGHTWKQRRQILELLVRPEWEGPVRLSKVWLPDETTYKSWVDDGVEGAVCKSVDSTYRLGKRSRDWLKYKPQVTDEAVVIGYELGKGVSNSGCVGALKIRMLENGAETTVAYNCVVEDVHELIGRIAEIQHYGMFSSGKPRHPGLRRWRPDRDDVPMEPKETEMTTKKPKDPSKTSARHREVAAGAWVRNYGAMAEPKLRRCIAELESGSGDAVDRVLDKNGSVSLNLERAHDALAKKAAVAA